MNTTNITTENTELRMALDCHKQEVHAKETAKVEGKKTKEKTSGNLRSRRQENPSSLPTNTAPIVGNMFFQVCGGVESTLAALQGIVFANEAKLMETGTELAQLNYSMQGKESQCAYKASVTAGEKQRDQMRISAAQSFSTAGVTIIGAISQAKSESTSEEAKDYNETKTKLSQQEKLAAKLRPDTKVYTAAKAQIGDISLDPAEESKLAQDKSPEAAAAVKARAEDLIATGGGSQPYKIEDEKVREKFSLDKDYDAEKGSYHINDFDDQAIQQMNPKARIAAHKAVEDQIKATKQKLSAAEGELTAMRQKVQMGTQLGTQLVSGTTQVIQANAAYAQKLHEAKAAVENQSFGISSANTQLATKMTAMAVDEGKSSTAAIMASIASANGRG